MSRACKVSTALLVIVALAALAAPAWAQVAVPPPVPPGLAPTWAVVPNAPKVQYAPNVPGDVFRLPGHTFYYYYGGYWYRSKGLWGPWQPVKKLPKAILRIPRQFFKSAPPW